MPAKAAGQLTSMPNVRPHSLASQLLQWIFAGLGSVYTSNTCRSWLASEGVFMGAARLTARRIRITTPYCLNTLCMMMVRSSPWNSSRTFRKPSAA